MSVALASAINNSIRRKRSHRTTVPEMGGTSVAAPHVSGLIATFLSKRLEFTGRPDDAKRVLLQHCTGLGRQRNMQGAGMPNLVQMLVNVWGSTLAIRTPSFIAGTGGDVTAVIKSADPPLFGAQPMKRFVIEREMPGVGNLTSAELQSASQNSCNVLRGLGTDIQWEHSYVTGDHIYCVYLGENEEIVREHARRAGFPATAVKEVLRIIDPMTSVNPIA